MNSILLFRSINSRYWAEYTEFWIDSEANNYALHVTSYTGDAGDGLFITSQKTDNLNGRSFSTYDNDNDLSDSNCDDSYNGGWWFNYCASSSLTGEHNAYHFMWDTLSTHTGVTKYLAGSRMFVKRQE